MELKQPSESASGWPTPNWPLGHEISNLFSWVFEEFGFRMIKPNHLIEQHWKGEEPRQLRVLRWATGKPRRA